jgi:hypothetical protein
LRERRKPKVKEKLKVVTKCTDHPFLPDTVVEVTESREYGVVWAKDESGCLGCLVPDDYMFMDSEI